MPRSGISGTNSNSLFNFWRNTRRFSKVAVLFYIFTSIVWRLWFLHIPVNICYCQFFFFYIIAWRQKWARLAGRWAKKSRKHCTGIKCTAFQDLMPDDLRWSWCNNKRNKLHNKYYAFESSWNHPPLPVHGKIVFHETTPGAKKVGNCCGRNDREWLPGLMRDPQLESCRWAAFRFLALRNHARNEHLFTVWSY